MPLTAICCIKFGFFADFFGGERRKFVGVNERGNEMLMIGFLVIWANEVFVLGGGRWTWFVRLFVLVGKF